MLSLNFYIPAFKSFIFFSYSTAYSYASLYYNAKWLIGICFLEFITS